MSLVGNNVRIKRSVNQQLIRGSGRGDVERDKVLDLDMPCPRSKLAAMLYDGKWNFNQKGKGRLRAKESLDSAAILTETSSVNF